MVETLKMFEGFLGLILVWHDACVCVAAMSLVCLAGCYLSMIESLVITINIIVDAIKNVVPTFPFINNIFAFVK